MNKSTTLQSQNRALRTQRKEIRIHIQKQKLLGLVLILFSFIGFLVCATGNSPETRDATALVPMITLGFYLLFTKERLFQ